MTENVRFGQKGTGKVVSVDIRELAKEVADLILWAYGQDAKVIFKNGINYGFQRPGQAFMNTLYRYDRESYFRLSQSSVDPFHDDSKLYAAMDALTSK